MSNHKRLRASDFDPEVMRLFDQYVHGAIDRRGFLVGAARFAAGESEHTAFGARELIVSRAVGIVQPDVARSGGISETRDIAALARAFHVAYAPHVGASGAVCAAASLHLAAAAPNFVTFECMTFRNPLREKLTKHKVGDPDALVDSTVAVPQGPGLGIEIDFDVLESFRVG